MPWIPVASFSADPQVARYGPEGFSEIDITGCVAANHRIISQLLLAREEVRMTGHGTDLTIRLPGQRQPSSRTHPDLLPDRPICPGVPTPALTVSGTLRTDPVPVVKHRELNGARADRFRAAAEIAEKIRKSGPLRLRIEGNRFADGSGPFADGIRATGAPEYRGAVTEVAIGTGVLSADRVDWSLNCLLDAGAAGVRLGVGNGLTGRHFDSISPGARLDTL
ncbi:hypothetical protein ABTY98_36715 [Streptomyces sp. NPDC096040]|uniref:hypothetical protein n=1 Tax=Streptomyces sp. NPDC096040 TaxID=3155541 RepID=UPI0033310A96